ncbi:TPA: hypothetical protein RPW25_001946 [Campylobacter fetus subsp. venerealis]|jgi:hypothetical protein|nr:hypothetical protein [Campylobacter fetus subsp. venerealis]
MSSVKNQSIKGEKMATAITYEKYEYMTKRQIFTALLNAEKKFEKMKSDLESQKDLVNFLKAKSKKKIDEKEISIPALDEAIAEYQSGKVEKFKTFDEFERSLDA